MPRSFPPLTRTEFAEELVRWSPEPLGGSSIDSLFLHYQELIHWSRTLSLIGPGNPEEIVARHYGESLAALPLIPQDVEHGVDIGSGAGFPGQVISAVRPRLRIALTEVRERKWSFLLAASRKASLPCPCLNVRVAVPLPEGLPQRLDLVTTRALRLKRDILAALAARLEPSGRVLLWVGADDPDLPPQLVPGRTLRLPGSEKRRILELRLAAAG